MYAAEVLLGLQYFHQHDIVYRDLKLDNILLGKDGHVKIADYGLCKERMPLNATTRTFCGTPEFMAPEILLEKPYTRVVDWWALGVLIYEMLLGQSPFRGSDEDEMFQSILRDDVMYPVDLDKNAVSIISSLLVRNPLKRLGAGENDAEDIKMHPYFAEIDFVKLHEKKIPAPYVPKISDAKDTSNFDEEFTNENPVLTPVQYILPSIDQKEFEGFTYTAHWMK